MEVEITTQNYNEKVEAINNTFEFFYPGQQKPEINRHSLRVATLLMYQGFEKSKKYAVAVALIKHIPKLQRSNPISWLAKLPWSIIKEEHRAHNKIYNLVRDVIARDPEYYQLYLNLINKDYSDTEKILSKYKDLIG
ncbi:hypothetical protein ACSIGC_09960 [Tenacibaculum sp. ZS6-P6]|uniref:hypothetical protein n=1 Tax=Tenacibaculum sp. ZS6-P6 TaxID=3447503 RepID=UPI003F9575C6